MKPQKIKRSLNLEKIKIVKLNNIQTIAGGSHAIFGLTEMCTIQKTSPLDGGDGVN